MLRHRGVEAVTALDLLAQPLGLEEDGAEAPYGGVVVVAGEAEKTELAGELEVASPEPSPGRDRQAEDPDPRET
jgi:hypothetical protein